MSNRVELQPSEAMLGEYQAQIARPATSGWVASLPMLHATVTTRRLILVQQTRRPHPAASIPGSYIKQIALLALSHRPAVQVSLYLDYVLHLFIGWGKTEDFARDLRTTLPPRAEPYQPVLPLADVRRMIDLLRQL